MMEKNFLSKFYHNRKLIHLNKKEYIKDARMYITLYKPSSCMSQIIQNQNNSTMEHEHQSKLGGNVLVTMSSGETRTDRGSSTSKERSRSAQKNMN